MQNSPITATQCFVRKTKEEEDQVEKTYKRYRELIIPTLSMGNGWFGGQSCQYQGFWFNEKLMEGVMYLQEHFKPRPTDVLLATAPKCGTTWLKALVFSIMKRESYTNMEEHPLLTIGVHECVPFLEVHLFKNLPIGDPEILPSPRLLCTHVPYSMLPESAKVPDGCRIVHVWRDPKDALISFWHFVSTARVKAGLPELSLEEAFDLFSQGKSLYGPFWDQVLGYWQASMDNPNKILFLKYENMITDPVSHLKKLAEFLGKSFTVEEEESGIVHEILKLCSFETLSNAKIPEKGTFHEGNSTYQGFFRKGVVGDSKNYLTTEMIRSLDEITEEKFKGTGISAI